jgi:hypothetical protein
VAGITGVPTAATAVVLDVTAVSPTANGALSVYTDGQPRSGASVVTRRGKATTNQVIVPVGSTDRIRIYNNSPGSTHVLVDVVGYHVSGSGAAFEPVGARRVLDSRNGTGGYRTAWNHNVTRNVTIAGHGGVPANATAVVLNVSALSPPAGGYATMWPAATTRPAATAMSWSARELTSKQVTVKLGSGGRIAVFTSTTGPVHLTADVVGWYGPGASTRYVPMTPVHTFDTRSGLGVGGSYPLQANETRAVTLAAARIPGGARAVNVNIRVENTFTTGSATAWDGAGRRPGTWSLAWGAGASPAHLVTTRIRNGGFSIYNRTSYPSAYGDVVGYYAP